ncbi:unnamed protein product, partial [Rotaria magnacalcarata]
MGGFRKLFGMNSESEPMPETNYYASEDDDYYEPPVRRNGQQQVLMRTGRTQENTGLNVRARQKNDEVGSYVRRGPLPPPPPSYSYNQTRNQYGSGRQNDARPTAVGRAPPAGVRCYDCGSVI